MGDKCWPANADTVQIESLQSVQWIGTWGLLILREAVAAAPALKIGSILTSSRILSWVAIALLLLVARAKVSLGLSCYSGEVSV